LPAVDPLGERPGEAAAAVARIVLANTMPVKPLASRPEPTLKPNQPTHSSEAPTFTIARLCGAMADVP